MEDTLNISNDQYKVKTMKKINDLGKFMIDELKMPKWMKQEDLTCFATTVISASPPQIQAKDGVEFEFEDGLTSSSLLSMKKAKRHKQARDLIAKDSMLVVPKQ